MVRLLLLLLLLAAPALPLPLRLPPAGGCAFPVGGLDVNSHLPRSYSPRPASPGAFPDLLPVLSLVSPALPPCRDSATSQSYHYTLLAGTFSDPSVQQRASPPPNPQPQKISLANSRDSSARHSPINMLPSTRCRLPAAP
ncbi:uncharacterized protein SETTUDRAFT_33565 [Exserohilum turcica Et28A]|uniref:Uncharacterized protein n=1 Tax=Exserohilum turcicum (strain 28A) TaxID=671987 RepID=R0IDP0_EXST2|nr:uncharacterized protein SETTUDRAFT_33565 [Exserohilum turcica Et28A]EOA83256.1 hypothetical protein SETTUDRAFT_33565 [Exserohilum turcica Et28A]